MSRVGWVCLSLLGVLFSASLALAQVAQKGFAEGSSIEVSWRGEWYPAELLEANHGWYRIHYDGYDATWDEIVDGARVREASASGPPQAVERRGERPVAPQPQTPAEAAPTGKGP
jgi:hypothetical protein